jgi:hypothetical protein
MAMLLTSQQVLVAWPSAYIACLVNCSPVFPKSRRPSFYRQLSVHTACLVSTVMILICSTKAVACCLHATVMTVPRAICVFVDLNTEATTDLFLRLLIQAHRLHHACERCPPFMTKMLPGWQSAWKRPCSSNIRP